MSVCKECGLKMSCGCQKRTAADGRACCSKCVMRINNEIKSTKLKKQTSQTHNPTAVTVTAVIKKK